MTLCLKTGHQCNCQPDEGVFCPDYKPDEYVQYLMNAITELRQTLAAQQAEHEAERAAAVACSDRRAGVKERRVSFDIPEGAPTRRFGWFERRRANRRTGSNNRRTALSPADGEKPKSECIDHGFAKHISSQLLNSPVRCETCGTIVTADASEKVLVPRELVQNAISALYRHMEGLLPMRIPANPSDSDVVHAQLMQLLSAAGGMVPSKAQEWKVFCAGCHSEWVVPYHHPGRSICTNCESKLHALAAGGMVLGEDAQAYNAEAMRQALRELIGPVESERLAKTPWARSVVDDLIKRIINLRVKLAAAKETPAVESGEGS